MSTFDQTIRGFLTTAASSSPTPGGGSVAALVAALGASMTSMVGNLTQGAKFAELEPEMQRVVKHMNSAMEEAETLLEQDMATFDHYMAVLKMPKDTDEQKQARSQALAAAAIQATEVPLRLARLCRDCLLASQTISATANKNVISDLGIAALLLEAATQSALITVDINLPSIKDAETRAAYTQERDRLSTDAAALKNDVVNTVRGRL